MIKKKKTYIYIYVHPNQTPRPQDYTTPDPVHRLLDRGLRRSLPLGIRSGLCRTRCAQLCSKGLLLQSNGDGGGEPVEFIGQKMVI